MSDTKPFVELVAIAKSFPGVRALSDISLKFYAGHVHVLLGENGAGKSTIIKIISGVYQADDGLLLIKGETERFFSTKESLAKGISVIHQELSVISDLTVAENIFLGREPQKKTGLINRQEMINKSADILETLGVIIDPNTLVRKLSNGERQMVEIARAVSQNSRLVIMDEPTSSLSDREVRALFTVIQQLKEKGVAIIYISHRLPEIREIGDTISVLRDGQLVKTTKLALISDDDMITLMVGRTMTQLYYKAQNVVTAEIVLEVTNISKANHFSNISFKLNRGEVLGISGLIGSGRTEVVRAIFGADQLNKGTLKVNGDNITHHNVQKAIKLGMGFIPENRREQSLLLEKSVRENTTLASLRNHSPGGWLNRQWENQATEQYIAIMKTKTRDRETLISYLSGGNQQKVVIGRWLLADTQILIMDEPTRGIDINAKAEIYQLMKEFVENGGSIIIVSSDLPEILGVSDRIMVMREGYVAGIFTQVEASEERIMRYASLENL